MDPLKKKKKKMLGRGLNPVFLGEGRLYCNAVRLHLIPITTTLLSINYVITSLYIRHSCRQTELKTMLSSYFLRCQNESKTTVKENIVHNFCFQELQDGTGLDYACSSW